MKILYNILMIEVPDLNSAPPAEETINYLYVKGLEEFQNTSGELVKASHVIVVGHEGADSPKPRHYESETARRTRCTGEAVGAIIGGSYKHEATGGSYNTGLLEHVDGRFVPKYIQVNTAGYIEKSRIKSPGSDGTLYMFRKYKASSPAELERALNCFIPKKVKDGEYFNSIHIQKFMFADSANQDNLFGVMERQGAPQPELVAEKAIFIPLLATVAFVNGFGRGDTFHTHQTNSASLTDPENPSTVRIAGFRRIASTGRVVVPDGQPVPKSLA